MKEFTECLDFLKKKEIRLKKIRKAKISKDNLLKENLSARLNKNSSASNQRLSKIIKSKKIQKRFGKSSKH